MNKLPVFPGRTTVSIITPPKAPGTKTVTFANGGTQSWETGARAGWFRVSYSRISEQEIAQIQEFFESHKAPEQWQFSTSESTLNCCYFSPGQPFPRPIKHAQEGYILELAFQSLNRA